MSEHLDQKSGISRFIQTHETAIGVVAALTSPFYLCKLNEIIGVDNNLLSNPIEWVEIGAEAISVAVLTTAVNLRMRPSEVIKHLAFFIGCRPKSPQ